MTATCFPGGYARERWIWRWIKGRFLSFHLEVNHLKDGDKWLTKSAIKKLKLIEGFRDLNQKPPRVKLQFFNPGHAGIAHSKRIQTQPCEANFVQKRAAGRNLVKSLMCCIKCDPPLSTKWYNEEWSQRYNWKSWSNSDSLWNEEKIHRKGSTTLIWSRTLLCLYDANQSVWGNFIASLQFPKRGRLALHPVILKGDRFWLGDLLKSCAFCPCYLSLSLYQHAWQRDHVVKVTSIHKCFLLFQLGCLLPCNAIPSKYPATNTISLNDNFEYVWKWSRSLVATTHLFPCQVVSC